MKPTRIQRLYQAATAVLFVIGLILGALALFAPLLGLDLSPGFGILQTTALLLALAFLTLALFMVLRYRRPDDAPRSLQADIGVRLAATGLVLVFVAGLSDIIGIGTHVTPNFDLPFVGPLQMGGILLGVVLIISGALLYTTSRGTRAASSMEFLLNHRGEGPTE